MPPELRAPRPSELLGSGERKVEKALLREAFWGTGLLPDKVLLRTKEAFSDGVSPEERSWYEIIQKDREKKVSDVEFEQEAARYSHLPPKTKEALYYRQLFERYFHEENSGVVRHYWLPHWTTPYNEDNQEPAARAFSLYKELVKLNIGKREE